jgi:hypothetical protein
MDFNQIVDPQNFGKKLNFEFKLEGGAVAHINLTSFWRPPDLLDLKNYEELQIWRSSHKDFMLDT